MVFWNEYLKWVLGSVIALVAVPYLTALIVSWLGHYSKQILVTNLGANSQLFVGGLGVVIHEFGHMIFAFLFGHRVTKVQLLNIHYTKNGSLGSVSHSWNQSNLYQRLGNFFIGLAPYYMCSIALFGLQKLLLRNNLSLAQAMPTSYDLNFSSMMELFLAVVKNFGQIFSQATWPMIIFYLILSVMISSTGYDLSSEDFQTVNQGILPWLIIVLFISIACALLQWTAPLLKIITVVIGFSTLFVIQGLLYVLLSIIVLKIISIF